MQHRSAVALRKAQQQAREQQRGQVLLVVEREQSLNVDVELASDRGEPARLLLLGERSGGLLAAHQQDLVSPIRLVAIERAAEGACPRQAAWRGEGQYAHQPSARSSCFVAARRSDSAVATSSRASSSRRSICSPWRSATCSKSACRRPTTAASSASRARRRAYGPRDTPQHSPRDVPEAPARALQRLGNGECPSGLIVGVHLRAGRELSPTGVAHRGLL